MSPNATGAAGFFSQLGATSGDPRQRVDTNNQLIDSLSWKMNKHDVKFGGEFEVRGVFLYRRTFTISMTNRDFRKADVSSDIRYSEDQP